MTEPISVEIISAKDCLSQLGAEDLPLTAAVQFYQSGVNLNMPFYPNCDGKLEIEIGVKSDSHKVLLLLDLVVKPFRFQRSCGLARSLSLDSVFEMFEFTRRVSLAMAAGNFATQAGVRLND